MPSGIEVDGSLLRAWSARRDGERFALGPGRIETCCSGRRQIGPKIKLARSPTECLVERVRERMGCVMHCYDDEDCYHIAGTAGSLSVPAMTADAP